MRRLEPCDQFESDLVTRDDFVMTLGPGRVTLHFILAPLDFNFRYASLYIVDVSQKMAICPSK